jgi:predicted Zn-dependent protease
MSFIRDEETEKFLKDISQKVFKAAGLDPDSIKIIIVNENSINAFVAGGQKLFIHTGLITQSENVAGLIGVIAHETGHIKGAHIIQKDDKIKNASIGSIAGYVLGLEAFLPERRRKPAWRSVRRDRTLREKLLSYSRDYENAADTVALSILKKINISPMDWLEF